MIARSSLVIFASLLIGAAACGSEGQSLFDENHDAGGGDGGGGSSSGGFEGGVTDSGGNGGDGGISCGNASAEAKLTPVNMVVVYDRSGSMGDTKENAAYKPELKWIPVGDAMKAFFTAPASAGMSATLTYFPQPAPTTKEQSCTQPPYETADVALVALPSNTFGTSIDTPANAPVGDTPTRWAVGGALKQVSEIATQKPADKNILVLVTDGEPYGCGIDNSTIDAEVQRVADQVAAVKATVPVYVIGVGNSIAKLDKVATAAGTALIKVDVGDPSKTKADLLAAMDKIRGTVALCDFDIPAPPDGRTLDFNKVYVEKISGAGVTESLPYVADCAGGKGWHFDDAAAPKKVILCADTCQAVKSDNGGKVNVSFRCVDRPDVPR